MENNIQTAVSALPRRSSQTYVVATAFFSLLAIVGFALYGLPFFYDFFSREFGWSRSVVTSGNALGKILVAPLFGFIAGWIIDRYGPRRMLMAGALMTGAALIGLSLMNSLGWFYLFYVFNALGYVFGGPLPCQVLVSRWFTRNRGKAMGIAYLGIGTGGALVPLIASMLEKNIGWHLALTSLGIMAVLISFPLAFFIKDTEVSKIAEVRSVPHESIKNILRTRNFFLLFAGSMCAIAVVGGINMHLKYYLRDLNFSQSQSAYIMSLVLFVSLAGRVLMGILADMISRKYVMILIYLIVASAIPLLLVPEFPGRIYIFAIIFGIGLGGDYMIIPLMAADLFGVKTLGRVMGIILVANGLAEAGAPYLVARMYDYFGKSYTAGFIVLICIALTGVIVVTFLPKSEMIMKEETVN